MNGDLIAWDIALVLSDLLDQHFLGGQAASPLIDAFLYHSSQFLHELEERVLP